LKQILLLFRISFWGGSYINHNLFVRGFEMKKLMVLMVVMAAVSIASAGLYDVNITVDGVAWTAGDVLAGSTIGVELRADSAVSIMGDTVVNINRGINYSTLSVTNPTYYTVVATASTTANGAGFDVNFDAVVDGIPALGSIYSFSFVAVEGLTVIDSVAGTWGSMGAVPGQTDTYGEGWGLAYEEINVVVPEPMTMALLGLGGLFLRRRSA